TRVRDGGKPFLRTNYCGKKSLCVSNLLNPDPLTGHLLDMLNLRLRSRKDNHPIDRYGDINRVCPRELGVYARRSADRCHVDTSAHKRLDRSRSGGDIDQLNIQTMALEYSRLFGNPRYGKSRSDRSVGDAELLQPLRCITRVRAKQE